MGEFLERIGAPRARRDFDAQRAAMPDPAVLRAEAMTAAFGAANAERATVTAHVTMLRAQHALTLLGENIPTDLRVAAQLRIDHPGLSLDELGRQAVPPLTKDTLAGRLRRLLHRADAHAARHHLSDTMTVVPAELRC